MSHDVTPDPDLQTNQRQIYPVQNVIPTSTNSTKMKLQIMSDSHMQVDCGFGREYGKFDFPVAAPNLVLLGGMGRICDQELRDFIVAQLARFERVFYVMGEDEFYGSTFVGVRVACNCCALSHFS